MSSTDVEAAHTVLKFLGSPEAADAIIRSGLEPTSPTSP
jgi:hypothetical protein